MRADAGAAFGLTSCTSGPPWRVPCTVARTSRGSQRAPVCAVRALHGDERGKLENSTKFVADEESQERDTWYHLPTSPSMTLMVTP